MNVGSKISLIGQILTEIWHYQLCLKSRLFTALSSFLKVKFKFQTYSLNSILLRSYPTDHYPQDPTHQDQDPNRIILLSLAAPAADGDRFAKDAFAAADERARVWSGRGTASVQTTDATAQTLPFRGIERQFHGHR